MDERRRVGLCLRWALLSLTVATVCHGAQLALQLHGGR